jgi:GNAT superfamily N-acetyltransferase
VTDLSAASDQLRLYDQHSPDAAALLRELHDTVLLRSFRPQEYVSPTVIKTGAGRPAIIACTAGGQVAGGALGHVYPSSGVLLLGYLAVRREFRGQGVGTAIMAALRERWLNGSPLAVLEMDDPRYHAPHPDYGDPEARLRFYGACGVRLLARPYFQPRLRPELSRVHHMFLGVIPPAGTTLPDTIPVAPVSAFLREYFADCEGEISEGDPELTRLLAAYRGPDIELVPTSDFAAIPGGPPDD